MTQIEQKIIVYTDGGSRGNPGPGAIGGAFFLESNLVEPRWTFKRFIGSKVTNNEAEYQAVVEALTQLQEKSAHSVTFRLDSELVVKQLRGEYKIKQPHLQEFFRQIRALSRAIPMLKFEHIPREQNKLADRLVNEALDEEMAN